MSLVYKATQAPVKVGDVVNLQDGKHQIMSFRTPHKPSSEGKVVIFPVGNRNAAREFYVSVIGAVWIEREDRAEYRPPMTRDEAMTAYRILIAQYGLRWTPTIVRSQEPWDQLTEINKVLTEADRREALGPRRK